MFGRHAIGMVWDFAEAVAVSNSASIFGRFLDSISQALENVSNLNLSAAEVRRLDACALSLPSEAAEGALEEDSRLTALFLWTIQTTSGEVVNSQSEESEEPDEEESEEEDAPVSTGTESKTGGFKLIYDVTRRFAQPLGIHLEEWEGRIIETKKGVVRLLQIRERSQQLFGDAGANLVADRIEMTPRAGEQLDLFEAVGLGESLGAVPEVQPRGRGRRRNSDVGDDSLRTRREATTLDRVHAAMLLQASGRSNALRALLFAETERSNAFLRLANALSLLYPKQSEEKRLLDAMLLAVPR